MELKASREGFVNRCDARIVGEIVRDLGGGRLTKETVINHDVGIDQLVKPGEATARNSILARVHAATQPQAEAACERLKSAFEISDEPPTPLPLICEVIS